MSDPSGAVQALEEARRLHMRGLLVAAMDLYAKVVAAKPGDASVWHLKGMAEHQAGRLDEALASAARALSLGGRQPPYLLLEGGVLHSRGALAEAEARFAELTRAAPRWALGFVELGRVRLDQERFAEAREALRGAVAVDANDARAWNTLGHCELALGDAAAAERAYREAQARDPRDAFARFNLARLHALRGDATRAIDQAQAAVGLDPRFSEAHALLGDLQRRRHRFDDAVAAYGQAIRAAPRDLRPRYAQADLLAESGHLDDARREYGHIAARFPDELRAALGESLLLPPVYDDAAHVERERERFAAGLERLHRDADRFVGQEPRWANFLLAYQGRDDRAPQARFGDFVARIRPASPCPAPPRRERVRVGFASHFFHDHPVARYFGPWIRGLDRERFEVFVYATNEQRDAVTAAIASGDTTFRALAGATTAQVASVIASDGPDVLVYPEIGMHGGTVALAARRLAPRQLAAWGHPTTTGLATIDAYLTVAAMEPGDAQAHYREALLPLPGIGTAYAAEAAPAPGRRADFGLPEGRRLYLVPQSLFKIHPDNDALLAAVAARDPEALLVLFASPWPGLTRRFTTRLARAFEERGLDLTRHVAMIGGYLPHAAYRRLNAQCDVMLDTLHWSGGNTSLDALTCGLPVVTRPGTLMRGRQSLAMLRMLGLDPLAAATNEQYVDTATRISRGDFAATLRDAAEGLAAGGAIGELSRVLYSQAQLAR